MKLLFPSELVCLQDTSLKETLEAAPESLRGRGSGKLVDGPHVSSPTETLEATPFEDLQRLTLSICKQDSSVALPALPSPSPREGLGCSAECLSGKRSSLSNVAPLRVGRGRGLALRPVLEELNNVEPKATMRDHQVPSLFERLTSV